MSHNVLSAHTVLEARPKVGLDQNQSYKTKTKPRPVWDRSCYKTAVSDSKTDI